MLLASGKPLPVSAFSGSVQALDSLPHAADMDMEALKAKLNAGCVVVTNTHTSDYSSFTATDAALQLAHGEKKERVSGGVEFSLADFYNMMVYQGF